MSGMSYGFRRPRDLLTNGAEGRFNLVGIVAHMNKYIYISSASMVHVLLSLLLTFTSNFMGKVAIVTGAAQGIGEAIAVRLAKDGFDIALADLPRANLQAVADQVEQLGRKAVCIPTDVAVQADVAALVSNTVSTLGRLDGEEMIERLR